MTDTLRATIEAQIVAHQQARDAALAQANQHQGAIQALQALLLTAPAPPEAP